MKEYTTEQLWNKYLSKKSTKWRNLLVERYFPTVKQHAERMGRKVPVQLDDLISDGTIGLINAIDTFDAERGIPFEAYSHKRIYWAMIDGMRKREWVPRSLREKAQKTGIKLTEVKSLHYQYDSDGDNHSGSMLDFLNDKNNSFQHSQSDEILQHITHRMSRTDALIISLYYWNGLNMRDVGKALGMSESRVSQLHKLLIQRLKARFPREIFKKS